MGKWQFWEGKQCVQLLHEVSTVCQARTWPRNAHRAIYTDQVSDPRHFLSSGREKQQTTGFELRPQASKSFALLLSPVSAIPDQIEPCCNVLV